MNKKYTAEIIVILEVILVIICFWYIRNLMITEGARYGVTSKEKLEQTAERPSKGQTEEVFKRSEEDKGGGSSGNGSTFEAIRRSLPEEFRIKGRSGPAGTGKGTLPRSLGSGKNYKPGLKGKSIDLAERSNRPPDSLDLNYNRLVCIGTFKITAYTAGFESTGKNPGDPAYGITASGEEVIEDHTIAADWDVLPPGSKVFIEGVGIRTVTDKGGLVDGKHIDLYIPDLDDALNWGVRYREVYLLKGRRNDLYSLWNYHYSGGPIRWVPGIFKGGPVNSRSRTGKA